MADPISAAAFDQIFISARSHNTWLDKPVTDELLHRLVELMNLGPTSANCLPARIVFVKTPEAKKRLEPILDEGNRAKTMTAPVCALIGYDLHFYENLAKTFPHNLTARGWFEGKPHAEPTAFRNSSLQGAYLMLAARALGLDTGPMSGFNNDALDREFFPGGRIKSNFICALGYGDASALFPRSPRLSFDEMATIV